MTRFIDTSTYHIPNHDFAKDVRTVFLGIVSRKGNKFNGVSLCNRLIHHISLEGFLLGLIGKIEWL